MKGVSVMKKVKVSEATEIQLDWMVQKAIGWCVEPSRLSFTRLHDEGFFNFSSDWSQGGPIIEQEEIYIRPTGDAPKWESYVWGIDPEDGIWQFTHQQNGSTPLTAAMRCYVTSKLGEEVEIPDEL
jgi:Protein of unknown function (DUF2591)